MTETKLYCCDICHTSYKNKIACEECEASHITNYEKIDFKYASRKGAENYPTKVVITFDNGRTAIYSIQGLEKTK